MLFREQSFRIALSPLDFERHGHVTAKAFVNETDEVQQVLDFCNNHAVQLLIIRCPTTAHEAAAKLSGMGMVLLDTLVHYQRDLQKKPFTGDASKHSIRPMRECETKEIITITEESFAHYPNHYCLDPRMGSIVSTEIFKDWAQRSCDNKTSCCVLVTEAGGGIGGYLTLEARQNALEMVLSGIKKDCKGQGIYSALVQKGLEIASEKKIQRIFTSTQITNLVVQKVWSRHGLELYNSLYTFHHWFF